MFALLKQRASLFLHPEKNQLKDCHQGRTWESRSWLLAREKECGSNIAFDLIVKRPTQIICQDYVQSILAILAELCENIGTVFHAFMSNILLLTCTTKKLELDDSLQGYCPVKLLRLWLFLFK